MSAMGAGRPLPDAEREGLDALRHGLGGAADRAGHVEHADGRDEGRRVPRAGLAERAPGRRLYPGDRAANPVGLPQPLAEPTPIVLLTPLPDQPHQGPPDGPVPTRPPQLTS